MATLGGVRATYILDGDHYDLVWAAPRSRWTKAEWTWWRQHGQEIVNTAAADYGPDVIGLLRDGASYGVTGDHGGAQESVQRIPIVFSGAGCPRRDRSRGTRSGRSTSCRRCCVRSGSRRRSRRTGRPTGCPRARPSTDHACDAGPVDARTTSWVGSTRVGGSTGRVEDLCRTSVSTARAPASSVRSARVVSGGLQKSAPKMSSKPTTLTSRGTDHAALGEPPHHADRQHVVVADHGGGAARPGRRRPRPGRRRRSGE